MTATAEQIAHAPTRRLQLTAEDVQEVSRQAAELRPIDAIQTILGTALWLVGWVSTKLFVRGWVFLFPVLAWVYVAVRSGSRQARNVPLDQPSMQQLADENQRLRMELARVS